MRARDAQYRAQAATSLPNAAMSDATRAQFGASLMTKCSASCQQGKGEDLVMLVDETLVELIYAGAESPPALARALASAAARVGASGANVHVVRKQDLATVLFLPVGANYTEVAIGEYFAHWRHLNPYRAAMRASAGVFLCHEHFSSAALARSAYAQDFYFHIGERWLAGAVCQSNESYEVSLVFNRERGAQCFGEHERRLIGELLPHMRRAASLAVRSAAAQGGVHTAIAGSHRPALLVDAHARLHWSNPAGETLLREARLLRISQGRVEAADDALRRRFCQSVRAAAGKALDGASELSFCLGEGGDKFRLDIMPATAPAGALMGAQSLALLLGRNITLSGSAELTLMNRFRLTSAEAALAREIAAGKSNELIAEQRQVSRETVRTQLRSIYAKTQVRQRAELVSLVWRLCG
jgi:DNA-binding CsgD family transcriptional regulator